MKDNMIFVFLRNQHYVKKKKKKLVSVWFFNQSCFCCFLLVVIIFLLNGGLSSKFSPLYSIYFLGHILMQYIKLNHCETYFYINNNNHLNLSMSPILISMTPLILKSNLNLHDNRSNQFVNQHDLFIHSLSIVMILKPNIIEG